MAVLLLRVYISIMLVFVLLLKGVQVAAIETVMSEIDTFVSSTGNLKLDTRSVRRSISLATRAR